MAIKKITMIISALILTITIGIAGISVFAANTNTQTADEQKAQITANREQRTAEIGAINEKWSALTDEQKQEIYSLIDSNLQNKIAIIDKYVQWGIIDAEKAAEIKASMTEKNQQIKSDNKAPMPNMKPNGKNANGRGMGKRANMQNPSCTGSCETTQS